MAAEAIPSAGNGNGLVAFDANGDGHLDLLLGDALNLSDGAGGFTAGPTLSATGVPVVLDYDLDGDADLAIGSASQGGAQQPVMLLENDGAGNFTLRSGGVSTPGGYGVTAGGTGDFDGDGRPDLALVSFGFQFALPNQPWFAGASVFRNQGYGGYDLDGSGVPDICE